ncbi:MAG TPA: hypothetical protein VJ225_02625 [Nitrososphaeraceae archaeon]|nr:hypothetical protein [Nitrososphaeraceae archaeon]
MDRQRLQFQNDIAGATSVVNSQLSRLRILDKKFAAMDKDFQSKIAQSIKSGNNSRAKALANELSNIRRVRNSTQNVSLALEVVVIRFSTINEFAMVMETINPTIDLIKEIHRDISTVVPSANGMISEVNSITSDVLINSNVKLDINNISTPIDTDAISILNDVEEILEDEARIRLPVVQESMKEIRPSKVEEETVLDEKRVMVEG